MALWPLSQVYRILWLVRRWLFRQGWLASQRLPVPVVVVGNVIAGGAGKTPLLLALAQQLVAAGWRPGIVSRGYGRDGAQTMEVQPSSPSAAVGDEALLLRRRSGLPVVVGHARGEAGLRLLQLHPDVNVVLSDDGLQHLALQRDVELCVFDQRGTGNGWLLPAGPLREPWPRRTDVVVAPPGVALGCATVAATRQLAGHAVRADGTTVPLSALRTARVVAVAGIAQPDAFFQMLRDAGVQPVRSLPFPDHFPYGPGSVQLQAGEQLLCTEKDAVKLWPILPGALAVPLEVTLAPNLVQTVLTKLQQATAAQL